MKISVAIPIYNAEKYVSRAVESALQFQDMHEVILSPYKALYKCLYLYEKQYEIYTQVIHQYNLMNVIFKYKTFPVIDFSEYRMTENIKFTIGEFKTLRYNIIKILFVIGFILKKIFKKSNSYNHEA